MTPLPPLSPLLAAAALLVSAPRPPLHDPLVELPPQFELVDQPGTYVAPTDLVVLPDGRWLVAEKVGRVLSPRPDGTLGTVLDLRAQVNQVGDRGLLAIAADPGFVPDGGDHSWLYALYTRSPILGLDPQFDFDGQYSHSMLVRFRVVDQDGDLTALASSEEVLLGARLSDGTAPDAIASLHNSHSNGSLLFAPDGTLLLSTGDGAHWDVQDPGGIDPEGFDDVVHPTTGLRGQLPREQDSGVFRSRDPRSLAGKVLRVDPHTGLGLPSNPWFDGDPASLRSRVWATGFRNPFRMAHRPGTGSTDPAVADVGQLLVGDVGWTQYEELDLVDGPGLDFGWPCFEGPIDVPWTADFAHPEPNPFGWPDCGDPAPGPVRAPLFAFHHGEPALLWPSGIHAAADGSPGPGFTGGCIIGGAFYTGGPYPSEYDGLYFCAEFGSGWLRTVELDAAGGLVAVRDFGQGLNRPSAIVRDPASGELLILDLGEGGATGHVVRLRHGPNLSPTALLQLDPAEGAPPLAVTLDAGGSSDPEAASLTYRFDFGDGSAPLETEAPQVTHTYTEPGLYLAALEVLDPGGLSDRDERTVLVGLVAPTVWIDQPATGAVVEVPGTLTLAGGASHPEWTAFDLSWRVDLYHDDHVHPAFYVVDEYGVATSAADYQMDAHGDAGDVHYYRVQLTATAPDGASAQAAAWVYPAGQFSDPAGRARPIARVFELDPAGPTGTGQPDLEVIRDGVEPGPDGGPLEQFVTEHPAAEPDDHWLGYELDGLPHPDARFVALEFQEGLHPGSGGWFEALGVEVRSGGLWQPVTGLAVDPPYPADPSATPPFERYLLHFDPLRGDAIRLRGTPGGDDAFVSCAELRVRMIDPAATLVTREDLSPQGTVLSCLGSLEPPYPVLEGVAALERLRNGTWPQPGATSLLAQVTSAHPGDPGPLHWFGYGFEFGRTLERVVFQEGVPQADGGWFESLALEVRTSPDGPWLAVQDASVTPMYRSFGPQSQSYETYAFDFAPRVVDALRVVGPPGGSAAYVSVGELQALGPAWDPGLCGVEAYGGEYALHTTRLECLTPLLPGLPGRFEVREAPPLSLGALLISAAPGELPVGLASILVDLGSAAKLPLFVDATGAGRVDYVLPATPALAGAELFAQVVSHDPSVFLSLRMSNALRLRLCP